MRAVRYRAALAVVAALAALAAPVAQASTEQSDLSGPDVASYQHPGGAGIDWAAVRKNGTSFAFVKATEGMTYRNPYFSTDYAGAHDAGLVRSAYHYARPAASASSAKDQAQAFVKAAGTARAQGDLPLTLDLEQSGGLSPSQLVSWTQSFVTEIQTLTGRSPILYTYPYFWQNNMGDSTAFTSLPLWIASYRSGGPKTPLPGGWKTWTFWQYTSSGSMSGIHAPVDVSLFSGSQASLDALADPTASSAPSAPTGPFPGLPPLPIPLPHLPTPPLPPTSHTNLPS